MKKIDVVLQELIVVCRAYQNDKVLFKNTHHGIAEKLIEELIKLAKVKNQVHFYKDIDHYLTTALKCYLKALKNILTNRDSDKFLERINKFIGTNQETLGNLDADTEAFDELNSDIESYFTAISARFVDDIEPAYELEKFDKKYEEKYDNKINSDSRNKYNEELTSICHEHGGSIMRASSAQRKAMKALDNRYRCHDEDKGTTLYYVTKPIKLYNEWALVSFRDFSAEQIEDLLPSAQTLNVYTSLDSAKAAVRAGRKMQLAEDDNPLNQKGFTYRSSTTPIIIEFETFEGLDFNDDNNNNNNNNNKHDENTSIEINVNQIRQGIDAKVIVIEKGFADNAKMPATIDLSNMSQGKSCVIC